MKNNGGEIIIDDYVDHDFDYYFRSEKTETFLEAIIGIIRNCKKLINQNRLRFLFWRRIRKGGTVIVWK